MICKRLRGLIDILGGRRRFGGSADYHQAYANRSIEDQDRSSSPYYEANEKGICTNLRLPLQRRSYEAAEIETYRPPETNVDQIWNAVQAYSRRIVMLGPPDGVVGGS
ncbi:hypothetical protein [Mesorhizobium sp. M5C.F.Ca.IN.020.32.2.1]|uniref:hypothetical protein n=1 Tax=Mesorhizobium sp. M5C.F.Ca.IN.020.32.2.1 TaxID=2496771 RepID=UPI000FD5CC06|nr:hypothetical protein [Mesorhizobium sp. M5C.F.Ca.IN.020.32.2.1]RUV30386.1 hypothetical protein EOA86_11285 [Mesorhizobium sp. M5C.F.Ca.IN.020.32.2.1]